MYVLFKLYMFYYVLILFTSKMRCLNLLYIYCIYLLNFIYVKYINHIFIFFRKDRVVHFVKILILSHIFSSNKTSREKTNA